MDLQRYLDAGELFHGHPCPPLAVGIRAGALAMERLGVERASERELFAFVEMSGDHYAQGFGDGIQIVTGCTFGKDNISRMPLGKFGVTLLDQRQGRGVRVVALRGLLDRIESSEWFRRYARSGAPGAGAPRDEVDPLNAQVLGADPEGLFSVSAVFPMGVEEAQPGFVTAPCEACGESVLVPYLREREGKRVCARCDDRTTALRHRP